MKKKERNGSKPTVMKSAASRTDALGTIFTQLIPYGSLQLTSYPMTDQPPTCASSPVFDHRRLTPTEYDGLPAVKKSLITPVKCQPTLMI